LARRLVDNGHLLSQREQAGLQADQVLRQRHEELVHLRQEMIAWRARLRVREAGWEGERQRLLADARGREELAERHLAALVELRQRWAQRRQEELLKLHQDREDLDATRQALSRQRRALAEQTAVLETDKRVLAEKSLALEQYRQEFLATTQSPAAQRRLERLRRRWITLHAAAIRAASRERASLQATALALDERLDELRQRADAVAKGEAQLNERQTSWEHKQTLVAARQSRLQHDLHSAQAQRNVFEQQVARMREEIERIARALMDEPDPPVSEALQHAA
jgi:chromosome segregation ATPase